VGEELAARVGLSPSPCLRRVRRLEQTGVIRGYQALVDPAAVGRGLRVFAGARSSGTLARTSSPSNER
jgi:Lrp/AsnC family leucine-responsive transcriptional regulator